MKILFLLSGSIACYKACQVISALKQKGHDVQTAATASALKFIGEATLEGLSGKAVAKGVFTEERTMDHIHLIHQADLVLLCPASANSLNKMAQGLGDDLVSTLSLAWDRKIPFHIFPAMNHAMWSHPATVESCRKLRNWGYQIHEPASGALACGELGSGRLLEPEQILAILETREPGKRILVTAGGTEVPIDAVRAITNCSTGRTGAVIADHLAQRGHQVVLLRAKSAVPSSNHRVEQDSFVTFSDLESKLREHLENTEFDMVVHAAAVSDFKVKTNQESRKLESGSDMNLELEANPKLVNSIKVWAKGCPLLVAFKLTTNSSLETREAKISKLISESKADLVVSNDTSEISTDHHRFLMYRPNGILADVSSAQILAEKLDEYSGGSV